MIWLGLDGFKPSRVRDKDGNRYVVADLMSDNVPLEFPVDGENIEGLTKKDLIDKGTTMYVVENATLYMRNSDGNWKEQ